MHAVFYDLRINFSIYKLNYKLWLIHTNNYNTLLQYVLLLSPVLRRLLPRLPYSLLFFRTRICSAVEMARMTKNASACCAVSANLVRMLHRTAYKHILVHAVPHHMLSTFLNILQHQKKISSLAYDIQKKLIFGVSFWTVFRGVTLFNHVKLFVFLNIC